MVYLFAADVSFLLHLAFILFVGVGAFAAWRWHWVAWIHLPTAVWAVLIQFVGWPCPLTELENHLRNRAGGMGYEGGFIEHYIMPIVYPADLNANLQLQLGVLVLLLNGLAYWVYFGAVKSKEEIP